MKPFIVLIGSLLLMGCASKVQTVYSLPELIRPPSVLLEDCKASPVSNVKTNADLVKALQNSRQDLDQCNNQIQALRSWYDTMETKVSQ